VRVLKETGGSDRNGIVELGRSDLEISEKISGESSFLEHLHDFLIRGAGLKFGVNRVDGQKAVKLISADNKGLGNTDVE
jgi:hypothetical protein